MAYITQEMKQEIAARLKTEFPGWSFRFKIIHHSKIRVAIVRANVDFLEIANQHNATTMPESRSHREGGYKSGFEVYGNMESYFGKNQEALEAIQKVVEHVNLVGSSNANFDDSDSMTDYFSVGYYTSIRIGGDTESTQFQYVPKKTK